VDSVTRYYAQYGQVGPWGFICHPLSASTAAALAEGSPAPEPVLRGFVRARTHAHARGVRR